MDRRRKSDFEKHSWLKTFLKYLVFVEFYYTMTDSPVAIITGGAQGLGALFCTELLKNGYRVCIADIQESKAEEFARKERRIYGEQNILVIRCDVSKESDFTKLFEQTLKQFQRVDVLINNAGIILEQDPRKCLDVNLLGTLFGCHAALKFMGKSNGGKGGVVINHASVAGFVPIPETPAYVASKHGVIGLTRSFGQPFHYEKDGIVFAALCPYFVDTEILQTVNKTLDPTLDRSKRTDKMSPESTVKGVMKILEEKINGSVLIVVPGGYHYYDVDEKIKLMLPAHLNLFF